MDRAGAERAVTISALIVVGVYGYERLKIGETSSGGGLKQLLGAEPPPKAGKFIPAWAATFLIVALMAEINPGLGGGFAILIATADLLNNIPAITTKFKAQETGGTRPTAGTRGTGATAGTQATGATRGLAATQATAGTQATGLASPSHLLRFGHPTSSSSTALPTAPINVPIYAAPRTTPNGAPPVI